MFCPSCNVIHKMEMVACKWDMETIQVDLDVDDLIRVIDLKMSC